MKIPHWFPAVWTLGALAGSLVAAPAGRAQAVPLGGAAVPPAPATSATHWSVRTSQGFDALCAINVLSGDPCYVQEYPEEAREFGAPRYDAARAAAARIKQVLKDQHGEIPSALLTLIFSGGPDSTLDAVLAAARHPGRLEGPYRASPYWSKDTWGLFLQVRPVLIRALESLRQAGFADDWLRHLGGSATDSAASMQVRLARYDVLGEQERLIGHPLQDGRIDVVLLWYSRPHGIRVQGSRFLTNFGYPPSIVLQNAAHEPLHPPYDRRDPRIAAALAELAQDSLLVHIVRDHNPSFGYTTLEGYVEEDAVQALEQVVSERLGFAWPAAARWSQADDGMHLLAAAIYQRMRESGFAEHGGRFAEWFAEAVHDGAFRGGEIARRARQVVGAEAVQRWSGGPGGAAGGK